MLFKEVNAIYFHKKIKVAFSLRMLFNMFINCFLGRCLKKGNNYEKRKIIL